ncbi:kleisin alpha [Sporobolomyces koalae]|uniref:kleisin alpha n=1 Tax=Sporobolomyces koalae TaxID=500713 RepID=UPI00317CC1C7
MSASNFFNQDLLTKRGALAQVWMASHLTTKLSKHTLTSTSIPKSVQSILGTQLASMAIRLSGQLLLGIARIYSRKTKYLLDDAHETLAKVKKAFQNEGRAAVDLPPEQQGHGSGESGARGGRDINLRRETGDLDDLLAADFGDEEWSLEKYLAANAGKDKGKAKAKALTANLADITLDESYNNTDYFDFGDLDAGGAHTGFELGLDDDFALFEGDDELNALAGNSQARPNKRTRADGEERDDGDISVELGRDAAPHLSSDRGSLAPLDFNKDEFGILAPEGGPDDFGGYDAGLNLGLDMDDMNHEFGGGIDDDVNGEKMPTFDPFASPRPDSVAPVANDARTEAGDSLQLTPRAAAAVNDRGAVKEPAKKRQKALAMDKVIELDWQSARLAGNDRFKEPEFLPRSRLHLALISPNIHLALLPQALPKTSKNALALESFAPPGLLAPELKELFNMPTRRERIKLEGRTRDAAMRDRPVELGRRAASVVSNRSNIRDEHDRGDELDWGFGGGIDGQGEEPDLMYGLANEGEDLGGFDNGDMFDFDLGLDEGRSEAGANAAKSPAARSKKQKTSHGRDNEREVTPARSVGSGRSVFEDEDKVYRSEGPLAIFDELGSGRSLASSQSAVSATPSRSQVFSQSLATEDEEAAAAATQTDTQKSGSISLQSRNTKKAVQVIQQELEEDDMSELAEKKVAFNKVAEKASRRAASSFFFELLVLSSADVIKIKQQEAYGDIELRATDKLREIIV